MSDESVSSESQAAAVPSESKDAASSQAAPAMAFRSPAAVTLFLTVTLGVLCADMALKYWAFGNVANRPVVDVHESATNPRFWALYPHDPVTIVPGVLSLKLTTNTGAVFGLGKGNRWFFVLASFLAIGVIGYLFSRSSRHATLLHLALALVLAGALGNLYDRWFYGAVRDMLYLFPGTNLWPWIFNLADVSLIVGVGLILLMTLLHELRQRNAAPSPD